MCGWGHGFGKSSISWQVEKSFLPTGQEGGRRREGEKESKQEEERAGEGEGSGLVIPPEEPDS